MTTSILRRTPFATWLKLHTNPGDPLAGLARLALSDVRFNESARSIDAVVEWVRSHPTYRPYQWDMLTAARTAWAQYEKEISL
jgi:hypothetical protein